MLLRGIPFIPPSCLVQRHGESFDNAELATTEILPDSPMARAEEALARDDEKCGVQSIGAC